MNDLGDTAPQQPENTYMSTQPQYRELRVSTTDKDYVVRGEFVTDYTDSYGTRFAQDCFDKSIKESKERGKNIPARYLHREPIGIVTDIEKTKDNGLACRIELNEHVERARETWELCRQGAIAGMSFGFRPKNAVTEKDKDGNEYLRFTECELTEISVVDQPANPETSITEVREAETETPEVSADDQFYRELAVEMEKQEREDTLFWEGLEECLDNNSKTKGGSK